MTDLRLVPSSGNPVDVTTDTFRIGRAQTCDFVIPDASVSRLHAMVVREGDEWVIEDQNSANGVYVDDQPVARAVLQHGTKVQIGAIVFRVEMEAGEDGQTVVVSKDMLDRVAQMRTGASVPPDAPTVYAAIPAPPAPEVSPRSLGLIAAVMGFMAVASAAAVIFFLREPRRQKVADAPPPTVQTMPTPPPPTPEPAPATEPPPPTPVPTVQGLVVVTCDQACDLLVDGDKKGSLAPRELRKMRLLAGEHFLTVTDKAGVRTDRVVNVVGNEQRVASFEFGAATPRATITASSLPPAPAATSEPAPPATTAPAAPVAPAAAAGKAAEPPRLPPAAATPTPASAPAAPPAAPEKLRLQPMGTTAPAPAPAGAASTVPAGDPLGPGLGHLNKGEYNDALEAFEAVARAAALEKSRAADGARAKLCAGVALVAQGKEDEAKTRFRQALALDGKARLDPAWFAGSSRAHLVPATRLLNATWLESQSKKP